MGKRKTSVFTVAKSVTNWFEASGVYSTTTEPTQEEADQVGVGVEVVDPSILSQPAMIQKGANQPSPIQPRLTAESQRVLAAHTQLGSPSDVAVPPGINEAASKDRPIPSELDPKREAALRAFWALLEDIGYET